MGKIELAWVPNTAVPEPSSALKLEPPTDQESASEIKKEGENEEMRNGADGHDMNGDTNGKDADYDVADDEDRWLAS